MVVVGVIALLGAALVFGGPRAFEKILPEPALAWIDENVGPLDDLFSPGEMMSMDFGSGSARDNSANGQLDDNNDGWKGSRKIAATARNTPVFIREVIQGRRSLTGGEVPGEVGALEPLAGCSFTPPAAGSMVGLVSARGGDGVGIQLVSYNDEDLAAGVSRLAVSLRQQGPSHVPLPAELGFIGYDVAVTETEQPVYLVLQGDPRNRVWNIVLAPGARLDRVVLLGGLQVGIANLPDGVPVEVLRRDDALACGIPRPTYPLNPGHQALQVLRQAGPGSEETAKRVENLNAAVALWDNWFRAAFGVSATENVIGNWDGISMAVVGPVPASPEARALWLPINGNPVRLTLDSYLDTAATMAEGVDYRARVEAITKAFAGGDLATLRPEVRF